MMGKWKLVVCGLLFSLFFGVTALAAKVYECVEVGGVQIVNGTVKATFDKNICDVYGKIMVAAGTPVNCTLRIDRDSSHVGSVYTNYFVEGGSEKITENKTVHTFALGIDSLEVNGESYPFYNVIKEEGWKVTIDPSSSITLRTSKASGGKVDDRLWIPLETQNYFDYKWRIGDQHSSSGDTFTLSFKDGNIELDQIYAFTSSRGSQTQPTQPAPPAAFGLASTAVNVENGSQNVTVKMAESQTSLTEENIKSAIVAEADKTRNYTKYIKDVSLDGVTLTNGQSVELTFDVPEAKTTSKVKALHYDTSNGWEEVQGATVTAQYKVKVKFTALSPVAILVYNAPASAPSGGGGQPSEDGSPDAPASESAAAQTAQGEKQSPKTSDSDALQYAYAVAALSLLGFAVCRKKSMRK